jgi:hypothetical protein
VTISSTYQSENISIHVFQSIPAGGAWLDTISVRVDDWQHEIRAVGGYWSGQFTLRDSQERIEEWMEGLGRRIVVQDEAGVVIWEGFVNRVRIGAGPLVVERGPLTDICNSVKVVYSELDDSVNPPVLGDTVFSTAAEDTDSQTLYGEIAKTLAVGGVTQAEAEQTRDTYLVENAYPETTANFSLGGGDAFSVTVECLGYVHWLDLYQYNQEADTGSITLSAKIQDALGADPNGFISTDYSRIETNSLNVPDYEARDLSAWGIIKDLVAKGDSSDNRYNFGIYENRVALYEQIPTSIEYQIRLRDPEQRIENIVGGRVKPWNVLPGKWAYFPDFLIGGRRDYALQEDPRALFIESVIFRTPREVQLNGVKVSTIQQKINRLGLSGLSA